MSIKSISVEKRMLINTAHLPRGSVVKVIPSVGSSILSSKHSEFIPAELKTVVVDKIYKNAPGSFVIDLDGVFSTKIWNVTEIVSRGTDKTPNVFNRHNPPTLFDVSKNGMTSRIHSNKHEYVVSHIPGLLACLMDKYLSPFVEYDSTKLCGLAWASGLIKTIHGNNGFEYYVCSKKKMRAFVKRNANRCLMSVKEAIRRDMESFMDEAYRDGFAD